MTEPHVDPTRAQFDAFKALPRDQPIEMLNLVAFRETAAYPADHPNHAEACFIARYPNAGAFLAMVTDPEYQKAVVHRQAAVATSRLIRCAPKTGGDGFA